ncbi:MAG: hypothetical protein WD851_19505 [Pirellulales bacterium]
MTKGRSLEKQVLDTLKVPVPPTPFQESDCCGAKRLGFELLRESDTTLGRVELRRQWSFALEQEVFSMLLNGNPMMSSAVHVSEDALADRGLEQVDVDDIDVLVGGLGLGFTGLRVLANERVRSATIIELLAPVIEWHVDRLFPWSVQLLQDSRLKIIHEDFFAYLARLPANGPHFHAILIDIDDTPDMVWHDRHLDFYTQSELKSAANHLLPGGVLAIWFAAQPEPQFLSQMESVFESCRLEKIRFNNPCLHMEVDNFLVLGQGPG